MLLAATSGCAPTTSSTVKGEPRPAYAGDVVVGQGTLPPSVDYEVVGTVRAKAQSGYDSIETMFPLLADEARKIGANAVMSAQGGRRPTAISWAAPFAEGTAIWVPNEDQRDKLNGDSY
jgi:uncharacterized protein YbjQ (UPF0145 family)